jgi:hypothetical protein
MIGLAAIAEAVPPVATSTFTERSNFQNPTVPPTGGRICRTHIQARRCAEPCQFRPAVPATGAKSTLISPEVPEPVRRKLGVSDGVLVAAAARWLSAPVVVQQILAPPGTVGESRPEEPSWPWAGTQQFVPASLSAGCAVQPFLWYCLGVGRSFLLFFGGFTPDEEAEIELMLWPVFLTTRPRCSAILVSTRKRR